jgi:hypothetical protein
MRYLHGKMNDIGKGINYYAQMIDNLICVLSDGHLKKK